MGDRARLRGHRTGPARGREHPRWRSAGAAAALLEGVARLRADDEVFASVLGPLGKRIAVTAVAADLSVAADRGCKKAVARAARTVRQVRRWA